MITITISYGTLAWLVFILGIVCFYTRIKGVAKWVMGKIYGEQIK